MVRTHPSQLPSADEFRRQLERMVPRPELPEQAGRHYVDFETAKELLEAYGVATTVFSDALTREVAEVRRPLDLGEAALDELVGKMLAGTPDTRQGRAIDAYARYLAEEDPPGNADAILVFGARTRYRAEKAVELFRAGHAPTLIFTGHGPTYQENRISEAERDKAYAIEQGVPEEAIIAETSSRTMLDNVRGALTILDARGIAPQRWISVAAPYCQRRGWAHLKKHLPLRAEVLRVNAAADPQYGRNVWFRSENGIRIYMNEALKLRAYQLLDLA